MFAPKRKVQRDREAGLSFVWRGARSNTGSLVVAFLLLVIVTAAVGSMVRVRVVPPPETIERHAVVTVTLDEPEHRKWAVLAAERSPFPSRFDPERFSGVGEKIAEMLELEELLRPKYQPELSPLAEVESPESLTIRQPGEPVFPPPPPLPQTLHPQAPEREVVAVLRAEGKLGARLPERTSAWTREAELEWIGRTLGFVVGLDGHGVVRHLMPLDEVAPELDAAAESWIRSQRFRPAPDSDLGPAWGTVEFRLEVAP